MEVNTTGRIRRISVDYPRNVYADAIEKRDLKDITLAKDFDASYDYVFATLSDNEKTCLVMRYKELKTLEEIGNELSLSRERIRQIVAKALRKLRHPSRMNYLKYGICEYMKIVRRNAATEARENALNEALSLKERLMLKHESTFVKKQQIKEEAKRSEMESLDLSVRAFNCLNRAGIDSFDKLKECSFIDLCKLRNLGRKSAVEISEKAAQHGVYLKESD